MDAEQFMTSPVLTVPPEASRDAIAALLVSHGIASAPVVDGHGHLLGMVSEAGVMVGAGTATARELMTGAGPVVAPHTPLPVLVDGLVEAAGRAVPVQHEGVLVGIVGRRDVLRHVGAGDLHLSAPVPERTRPAAVSPIVVGVDGTDSSLDALRWAIDQVRWTRGPRGLPGPGVHAVLAYAHPDLYGSQADSRRRAEAVLEAAVESATSAAEVEVVRVAREGRPAAVLADEARGASMVVLGTRDPGPWGPGSIASRLVGKVPCPVVVIPELEPARRPVVTGR